MQITMRSQAATKLLIDKGCKHIAHIRGPRDVSTANERFEGFVDVITQNNLSYMIAESTFDPANSERVAVELLEQYYILMELLLGMI